MVGLGRHKGLPPAIQAPDEARASDRSPPEKGPSVGNRTFHQSPSEAAQEVTMKSYIAILHKDKDSDYGVSFPDFPGCVSAGSSLEEAKDMAREALPFHVQGMQADGETVPEPMSLDAVHRLENARDAQAFFLVEVPIEDQIVRANITVPKGLLDRIDRYARAHHLSRSAFLTQAAQRVLQS